MVDEISHQTHLASAYYDLSEMEEGSERSSVLDYLEARPQPQRPTHNKVIEITSLLKELLGKRIMAMFVVVNAGEAGSYIYTHRDKM